MKRLHSLLDYVAELAAGILASIGLEGVEPSGAMVLFGLLVVVMFPAAIVDYRLELRSRETGEPRGEFGGYFMQSAAVLTWTMVVLALWQGVLATAGEGHEMPFLAVLVAVHLLALVGIHILDRDDEPDA